MKRYTINISATVLVEAENVAQANKLARQRYKLIGAGCGTSLERHNRDYAQHRLHKAELKFGRPIRLQEQVTVKP